MERAIENALRTGRFRPVTYEEQISHTLNRVRELVTFVGREHFGVELLHLFWHNERRAQLTINTIGRLLGRPLAAELATIRELWEVGLPLDLVEFSDTVAPQVFRRIEEIRPGVSLATDGKAVVESLHYAVDVREALLQHVLPQLGERYHPPRFSDLTQATLWTEAYGNTLHLAEEVIRSTRSLLREEAAASSAYLQQVGQEIERIETAAETKLGIIKRIHWSASLEEADVAIHNALAERAERMERVTFSTLLTEEKRTGFLSALARRTLETRPRLGLYLAGLAGVVGSAGAFAADLDLPNIPLPKLPRPLQGETNPNDTARMVSLQTGTFSTRSARHVAAVAERLAEQAAEVEQSGGRVEQAARKVDAFVSQLENSSGRQTFVIQNQEELRALVSFLVSSGYEESAVLDLLGLSSYEAFTHPMTLDIRRGSVMPVLFTLSEADYATAAHPVITPEQEAAYVAERVKALESHETAGVEAVQASKQTARLASLQADETFIVYRVQPDERLTDIAARYGTTVDQIRSDNNLLSETVSRGDHLLIRRPASVPAPELPHFDDTTIRSDGSFGGAAVVAEPVAVSEDTSLLLARYSDTIFPDLETMPEDARSYLLGTVQEVADFFNVRPGDLLGIMRLEQNNAGWRLQEYRTSTAGAVGVAQIVPRTWNGWSNPEHNSFVTNVLDIEAHGGLGFDWSKREEWKAWQEGRADRSLLADSNADPTIFENSVAGIARHLVHWGLTRDRAESDPVGFAEQLADAIAVYNSGRPLEDSATFVQSSSNLKTTAQYVAEAMSISEGVSRFLSQPSVTVPLPGALESLTSDFRDLFDREFATVLNDEQIQALFDEHQEIIEAVRRGEIDSEAGAVQLLEQVEQQYIEEGRNAILTQSERPWPYIHNEDTLYVQRTASNLLGRPLTLYEIDDLMYRTGGNRDQILADLRNRADARLFAHTRHLYEQMLQRSSRGLAVRNSEVFSLMRPYLLENAGATLPQDMVQEIATKIQSAIQGSPEYQELHASGKFKAQPLSPMPAVFKGFGVAVDYQVGGQHTGIDVANPRLPDGSEPPIYAVDDATVVHVGPLYCDAPTACRGGKAIVLDHGNNVYSIYSHNSKAEVSVGERVHAGQRIGLQGDEGYSFGSHLHLEVHVGAPFTGNWETPFEGGEFVDPVEWLP